MSAAIPILLAALAALAAPGDPTKDIGSKDPAVRLAAARELAAGGHAQAEKLLLGAVDDEDWEVAEAAARGLGQAGGKASVERLAKLALDGPVRGIRRAAAESLTKLGPEVGVDRIERKLSGDEAERALDALAILARAVPAAIDPKPLEKLLRGKEPALRAGAAAVLVLVQAGPGGRGERRSDLLAAEDLWERASAIEAAGASGSLSLLPAVIGALTADRVPDVIERRAIAAVRSILEASAGEDASARVESLLSAGRDLPDGPVRARFARLVGALAAPPRADEAARLVDEARGFDALAPCLSSGDAAARAAAAKALGAIGGERAIERLRELAKSDAISRVRATAFRALVERPGVQDEPTRKLAIELLARDSSTDVRETAAVALGARELDAAIEPLTAALSDRDWGVAACAAVSLGRTRLERACTPLEALFASEDWRLRGAAVVGLGHVYQKLAPPILIRALEDEDAWVQHAAHEALCQLARQRLALDAKVWKAWWEQNQASISLVDPEERRKREERFGYSVPDTQVYDGMAVYVLESRGDHIQNVLAELSVAHELVLAGRVPQSAMHPGAVFVANCTGEIESGDAERLGWFVRVGGHLFGSCWALQETIARTFPGVIVKLETPEEVLGDVHASRCAESPLLDNVFGEDATPIYALEGAHLIEVVDPERAEVLIDSPEAASRWGGGNLCAWFRAGHGVVLDSANHFEEQGLKRAQKLKKPEERQAYAIEHMGLSYEQWRKTKDERYWAKAGDAAKKVLDLSVFRLITNFVRQKRLTEG